MSNKKGVQISDKEGGVLKDCLSDILKEVEGGDDYLWCVLFVDGITHPNGRHHLVEYQEKINKPKDGLRVDLPYLFALADDFYQIYEITVLGSKSAEKLHLHDSEEEMYASCEFVIDLIDCTFWEVYSHNAGFLSRLKSKFRNVAEIGSEDDGVGIPCPHQHRYITCDEKQPPKRGSAEPVPGWEY